MQFSMLEKMCICDVSNRTRGLWCDHSGVTAISKEISVAWTIHTHATGIGTVLGDRHALARGKTPTPNSQLNVIKVFIKRKKMTLQRENYCDPIRGQCWQQRHKLWTHCSQKEKAIVISTTALLPRQSNNVPRNFEVTQLTRRKPNTYKRIWSCFEA